MRSMPNTDCSFGCCWFKSFAVAERHLTSGNEHIVVFSNKNINFHHAHWAKGHAHTVNELTTYTVCGNNVQHIAHNTSRVCKEHIEMFYAKLKIQNRWSC